MHPSNAPPTIHPISGSTVKLTSNMSKHSSVSFNSVMTSGQWQKLYDKLENYVDLLLVHNERVDEIRAMINATQEAKRLYRNDLYDACYKTSPNVAELINVRAKAIYNGIPEDILYLDYEYYELFEKLSRADKETVDVIVGLNDAIKAANIKLESMERELRKAKFNVVEIQRVINELHIVVIVERVTQDTQDNSSMGLSQGSHHSLGILAMYRQYTINIRRHEVRQSPYRYIRATTNITKYKTPYIMSSDVDGAKSKSVSPRLVKLMKELESTTYDVVTTLDV